MSSKSFASDANGLHGENEMAEADVQIITSTGLRIPAHSNVLAAASTVLESILVRPQRRRSSQKTIRILGVPCDAVSVFVRFLYCFKKIEQTEGWKFLQHHDPLLDLEILQFMDEAESRKKRRRRHIPEQNLYLQLSEGMDCLEHICTDGCTSVGPYDKEESCQNKLPCSKFDTCRGLQLLIRHVSTCKRRAKGSCSQCKRMWQLLRLHASICGQHDDCRVPLCREFKQEVEKRGDDELWKSLVRKVVSARVISSLSLPKRKREEEEPRLNLRHHQLRRFSLKTQC